ncbi:MULTISPECIES: C39 family peptidase [unclassified Rhizobium]|uniref:C39 family peptidase n=1 Tax=unclassified Rhizobium TaxID=2613769 RepID=UPI001ADB1EE7|nr:MULTISPECIES: C39 family peptidase [unclassified Rhizobium]MBO9125913.1 C39 family peptidase [Rhizobium sp. 16-488-2b]MBO9176497.1 C39 family peptidase [Rhizobium sp. 16-488-2a]
MNRTACKARYFSQWETASMTLSVLERGAPALLDDPLWQRSGAGTVEEYARWAVNICGMACLKMILAARGEDHRTIDLARGCTTFGGYVVNAEDQSIKGLIYAPFVTYVGETFGLDAKTITSLPTPHIADILKDNAFFIASVNSQIRWPDRQPPSKGGHLVLVTAASADTIRFHNPSGHDETSQADVELPTEIFDRFFANRGVAVRLDQ